MDYVFESQPPIIEQNRGMFMRILAIGFVLGIIVWMMTYTLRRFVLASLLCQDGGTVCVEANDQAGNIATILVGIAGVVALVRAGVYRPIIITLGTAVSLWGVSGWLYGSGALVSIALTATLYTVAYATYAWIVRVRKVPVMLVLFAVLIVISRVIPMLLQ